jgi:hypothetical protein
VVGVHCGERFGEATQEYGGAVEEFSEVGIVQYPDDTAPPDDLGATVGAGLEGGGMVGDEAREALGPV